MTLAQRLKVARMKKGLSQKKLAKLLGSSQQVIAAIENAKTIKPRNIEELAKVLDVSPAWLLFGETLAAATAKYQVSQKGADYITELRSTNAVNEIPLISWPAVVNLCKKKTTLPENAVIDWVPCPVPYKPEIYALQIAGDGMEPEYRDNDIIVVDPTLLPAHNKDVIIVQGSKVLFKQLQITHEGSFLVSLNKHYPERILPLSEKTKICGIVVFSGKKRI